MRKTAQTNLPPGQRSKPQSSDSAWTSTSPRLRASAGDGARSSGSPLPASCTRSVNRLFGVGQLEPLRALAVLEGVGDQLGRRQQDVVELRLAQAEARAGNERTS